MTPWGLWVFGRDGKTHELRLWGFRFGAIWNSDWVGQCASHPEKKFRRTALARVSQNVPKCPTKRVFGAPETGLLMRPRRSFMTHLKRFRHAS